MYTTRRSFLGLGAAALLDAVFRPAGAWAAAANAVHGPHREAADTLLELLSCRESAASIGRQYLAQYPAEVDADGLLGEFLAAAPDVQAAMEAGDAAAVRQAVFSRYRDDYSASRTVSIDGWLFSETEARICALAAMCPAG